MEDLLLVILAHARDIIVAKFPDYGLVEQVDRNQFWLIRELTYWIKSARLNNLYVRKPTTLW